MPFEDFGAIVRIRADPKRVRDYDYYTLILSHEKDNSSGYRTLTSPFYGEETVRLLSHGLISLMLAEFPYVSIRQFVYGRLSDGRPRKTRIGRRL